MTATMPEEDVEIAVQKAEGCQWGKLADGHFCDLPATHECLLSCPKCRTGRVPLCDQHLRSVEALTDLSTYGPRALCAQCDAYLVIVGVMLL